MADVFKFTEDQQTALKLIGGMISNLREFALGQDFDSAFLHCAAGSSGAT